GGPAPAEHACRPGASVQPPDATPRSPRRAGRPPPELPRDTGGSRRGPAGTGPRGARRRWPPSAGQAARATGPEPDRPARNSPGAGWRGAPRQPPAETFPQPPPSGRTPSAGVLPAGIAPGSGSTG